MKQFKLKSWIILKKEFNFVWNMKKIILRKGDVVFLERIENSNYCHFYSSQDMNPKSWLGFTNKDIEVEMYREVSDTKLGRLLS